MPRYFFNTQDGEVDRDVEGVDCASPQEARLEALKLVGRMLLDDPEMLRDDAPTRVWVTDETGKVWFEVDVVVAVSSRGDQA